MRTVTIFVILCFISKLMYMAYDITNTINENSYIVRVSHNCTCTTTHNIRTPHVCVLKIEYVTQLYIQSLNLQ